MKKVLLVLAACAVVLFGLQNANAAIFNPATGHWYKLVDATPSLADWTAAGHTDNPNHYRSWTVAETNAVSTGGHLVTINDAEENAWLVATFSSYVYKGVWIGLYQVPGSAEPAGGWVWISGDTSTYRNWAEEEPNNGLNPDFGYENWAVMYLNFIEAPNNNGFWMDLPVPDGKFDDERFRYGIAKYTFNPDNPDPDMTPDQFTFTDQTGVALNTVITSNIITVTGLNAATPISIVGGTYAINGGPYTSASGTVSNGSTVTVQQTSSANYSTTTDATLTIGGISDTFSVTTEAAPPDITPDQFTFADRTGVALNTVINSNAITVSGLNAATPISIVGGTYTINGGPYTSASGTVSNGSTVTVQQISSPSYYTMTIATLTIGGVSDTFNVTTQVAPSDSGGGGGDSGGGGGCFIATAAFGSFTEPHVLVLREFRDQVLSGNPLGRSFVSFYYKVSPPIANFISQHETLKVLVRWSLLPVVGLSWMALNIGLTFTLGIMLILTVLLWKVVSRTYMRQYHKR